MGSSLGDGAGVGSSLGEGAGVGSSLGDGAGVGSSLGDGAGVGSSLGVGVGVGVGAGISVYVFVTVTSVASAGPSVMVKVPLSTWVSTVYPSRSAPPSVSFSFSVMTHLVPTGTSGPAMGVPSPFTSRLPSG